MALRRGRPSGGRCGCRPDAIMRRMGVVTGAIRRMDAIARPPAGLQSLMSASILAVAPVQLAT